MAVRMKILTAIAIFSAQQHALAVSAARGATATISKIRSTDTSPLAPNGSVTQQPVW